MNKITIKASAAYLDNLAPFDAGSLRALRDLDGLHPSYGLLSNEEKVKLLLDEGVGIAYAVFSYNTPIAWVRVDGKTHYVDQKFSCTTSRHQNHVKAHLGELEVVI